MIRKDKFWKHYRIYFSVVFVLIIGVWALLWTFLDSYEAGRPDYLSIKITDWYKHGRYNKIAEYMTVVNDKFNTKEALIESIKPDKVNNVYFIKKPGEYKDNQPVYSIYNNNKEVLVVTLKPKAKKGLFGINRWEVDNILSTVKTDTIKIIAPKDAIIKINDNQVTEDEIINKNYYKEEMIGIKDYTYIDSLYEYEIKNLYPSKKVTISVGSLEEKDNTYTYIYPENKELLTALDGYLKEFCMNYTRYVGNETSFGAISAYLLPGTNTYELLRGISTTNKWSGDHTPMVFGDIVFSGMEVYNENAFKIKANYKYSYDADVGHQEYESNIILYLVKSNEQWKIVNLNT